MQSRRHASGSTKEWPSRRRGDGDGLTWRGYRGQSSGFFICIAVLQGMRCEVEVSKAFLFSAVTDG